MPLPHGLLVLDLLSELSGGSAPFRSDILADFRRVDDLDAEEMRRAADGRDIPQVLVSAHGIKGAAEFRVANEKGASRRVAICSSRGSGLIANSTGFRTLSDRWKSSPVHSV